MVDFITLFHTITQEYPMLEVFLCAYFPTDFLAFSLALRIPKHPQTSVQKG